MVGYTEGNISERESSDPRPDEIEVVRGGPSPLLLFIVAITCTIQGSHENLRAGVGGGVMYI